MIKRFLIILFMGVFLAANAATDTIRPRVYSLPLCSYENFNKGLVNVLQNQFVTITNNDEPVKFLLYPADDQLMKFWTPNINAAPSIEDYVTILRQKINCSDYCYMPASDDCYLAALIYIDRVKARLTANFGSQNSRNFLILSQFTFHRLFFTALLVAMKFCEEVMVKGCNLQFAHACGTSLEELNQLEIGFMALIGFDLYCSDEEFKKKLLAVTNAGFAN